MINWSRIQELEQEIGPEGLREIAEIFLEEVEEALAGLKDAPSGPARSEMMHFLKGSALNLGLREMADLCDRGESGDADVTDDHVVAAFARAKTALLTELGKSAA